MLQEKLDQLEATVNELQDAKLQTLTANAELRGQEKKKMFGEVSGDYMNTSQHSGYSNRSQEQYGQEADQDECI